jgi:hypothetical protein
MVNAETLHSSEQAEALRNTGAAGGGAVGSGSSIVDTIIGIPGAIAGAVLVFLGLKD